MEQNNGKFGWFIAGSLVGAAVALLYAPKQGSETRAYLGKTTQDTKEAMGATGIELVDKGKDLYERGRRIAEDAAELFERGRKLVKG